MAPGMSPCLSTGMVAGGFLARIGTTVCPVAAACRQAKSRARTLGSDPPTPTTIRWLLTASISVTTTTGP